MPFLLCDYLNGVSAARLDEQVFVVRVADNLDGSAFHQDDSELGAVCADGYRK